MQRLAMRLWQGAHEIVPNFTAIVVCVVLPALFLEKNGVGDSSHQHVSVLSGVVVYGTWCL